ncbi:MAG: hypothetical protein ABI345_12350 [Jatrophihabitans sp.]
MSDDDYVNNGAWLRNVSRVDAIDVVADQFERPVAAGAEAFWTADSGVRWPRSSRGWRSMGRLHPRSAGSRVSG